MNVVPIKTRLFREGEDLVAFIRAHVERLEEGSVLAVASKVVALSEGRVVPHPTRAMKERVIRAESDVALRTKWVWLTVKDGMLMANAGTDESNADGNLILLPRDSFAAAQRLRAALKKAYRIKKLGVIITDSRTYPMRAGVTGVALGYAGIRGVRDYRGKKDLYGRVFTFSQANLADGLAAAAVLAAGEGRERQPLVVITRAPVVFLERADPSEVRIPAKDDMYLPHLGTRLRKKKRK